MPQDGLPAYGTTAFGLLQRQRVVADAMPAEESSYTLSTNIGVRDLLRGTVT